MRQLAAFFFWTAWAAATNAPAIPSPTRNNWPHEPLVGNRPTGEAVVWTGVSIIMLLAGICAMVWWYASQKAAEPEGPVPAADPARHWEATPSQRATLKYFWVVSALILVQILLGVVTAHYGVEGDGFYGFPLPHGCPTASLAPGTCSSACSGLRRPGWRPACSSGRWSAASNQGQTLGVNVLFVALLVVVVGSLAGEWLSVQNKLSDAVSFYFGHQGYEYVDLGRSGRSACSSACCSGCSWWSGRSRPALKPPASRSNLLYLFLMAAGAIGLFYGAGLTWGQHTHLSIVEYWRWWVVHLWVEGFFEVFATTVIAFFFTRLNLIRPAGGGSGLALGHDLPGRRHHRHLPPSVLLGHAHRGPGLGIGVQRPGGRAAGPGGLRGPGRPAHVKATPWVQRYKWPIYFFVAVAFWNMVGAGLFGFMINPPIALYYMQGLNTTPLHGHAALFGVYGMLGIGLMLVCLRALIRDAVWKERLAASSRSGP